MFWIPLAMMAASLAKNQQDAERQKANQNIESAKARYAPWTGIKPGEIHYAQPVSNMIQGGVGAYDQYQQDQRNGLVNKLLQARAQQIQGGGGAGGAAPQPSDQWDLNGDPLSPWQKADPGVMTDYNAWAKVYG